MLRSFMIVMGVFLTVSCQVVAPYAPPPQPALVESVELEIDEFAGRPEIYAVVSGSLSTSAAQLIDARQSRQDHTLMVEVLEQTPRSFNLLTDIAPAPSFQTRIPIEILGLDPGMYLLNVNGQELPLEIPRLQAQIASPDEPRTHVSAVTLLDEFIPHENAVPPSLRMRSTVSDTVPATMSVGMDSAISGP